MKTFYFFRVERHTTQPRINRFTVTFDEASGGPMYEPNEEPQGIFVLEQDGRIIERSTETEISIPVIMTLRDEQLMTFNQPGVDCIASPDQYIIDMAAFFFRQGLMIGLDTLTRTIEEARTSILHHL